MGVEGIGDVMGRTRLLCHGRVERNGDADWVNAGTELVADGNMICLRTFVSDDDIFK